MKFHREGGPGQWAAARLVRYVADFGVMARYQSRRIDEWIKLELEDWMGLDLNHQETGIVFVESGKSLNFLGFSFRMDRDLKGRAHGYLNVFPSSKTIKKARERIREMTGPKMH